MSLDFLKEYGGSRLAQTELHSLMADELLETAESSDKERVILDYETTDWKAIAIDHLDRPILVANIVLIVSEVARS